jgi:hypothetical protein
MTWIIVLTVLNGAFALFGSWCASSAHTNRMLADMAKDGAARNFEWARREADEARGRNR